MNNLAITYKPQEAAGPHITYTLQPMRGIKQAVAEIKAADPYTALTERGLRSLINAGVLPCVHIGRKILVNMNTLNNYLMNGATAAEDPHSVPQIRRIKV